MRKKKKPTQAEGGTWLVTFSDLMTLLMLFFVLLYSMERSEGAEQQAIIDSIQGAFTRGTGILPGGFISRPNDEEADSNQSVGDGDDESNLNIDLSGLDLDELDLDEVVESGTDDLTLRELLEYVVSGYLVVQDLSSEVAVEYIEEGILLQLQDHILFESASANLRPESLDLLSRLGSLLAQFEGEIRVAGHTDNVPIGTDKYPSNWELGLARATSIVRYYGRQGFDESRFVPMTHGETRPIASNDTPEGRAKNRRVNFLIEATPEDVARLQELIGEYEEN